MGKKKEKKGKKGKKKGAKKTGEPEMTFEEAILAYQINIKEKQIEDYRYEVKGMEERNKRQLERNERLKSEQHYYIQHLLKQAKEFEKQLENAEVVEKEQVIAVMRNKWATERKEKQSVVDMLAELEKLDQTIVTHESAVSVWTDYMECGQHEHKTQIHLLEQELADMQHAFDEMAAYLTRTLDKTKADIRERTEETLDRQKFIASEKAMDNMDKGSRQEVLDNDWLKKETEIHTQEYHSLLEQVEDVEKKNLEIMSELFECKVEDLKISRNFFLTQFGGSDDLDQDPGILEIDLSKLSAQTESKGWTKARKPAAQATRPKSATQRDVEKKVFSLTDVLGLADDGSTASDEEYSEEVMETSASETNPDLDNYLRFDDEDFNAYLQLGPLELKLMSIQGQQLTIHTEARPPSTDVGMDVCNPEHWPVTQPMLEKVVNPPPPRELLYQ